jgi:hypothetical protein
MQDSLQVSNMKTLFGVEKIPTDDQIRNFNDNIHHRNFNGVFNDIVCDLKEKNLLNPFRVLNDKFYVIALDGSEIFTSKKIHCDNCIVKEHRNGQLEYVHNVLHSSLVSPKTNFVLPLPPEFNEKDDTKNKQDCEQKAIFRWFENNFLRISEDLGRDKLIFLADDLHSRQPFVQLLEENGVKYILNCKGQSHKTISEFTDHNELNTLTFYKEIPGFAEKKKYTFSWLSGLPIRDSVDAIRVN